MPKLISLLDIRKEKPRTISDVRRFIGKIFKQYKDPKKREQLMRETWRVYKMAHGIANPVKARPPKAWFDQMMRRIARMKKYRDFPLKRKQRIVAGIWHGYSDATKKRLLRRYE